MRAAGNRARTSAVSNEVTVTVTTAGNVPGAPMGLLVSVDGTRATLSWQRPVTGGEATGWLIELDTAPGPALSAHDGVRVEGAGAVATFRIPASLLSVSGDLPRGEYVARARRERRGPGASLERVALHRRRPWWGRLRCAGRAGAPAGDRDRPHRHADVARAARVTANAFDLLPQQPLLGRGFAAGDDRKGAEPVVIISQSVWRNRYGVDPGVLGTPLRVNGVAATIIGRTPRRRRR